MSWRRRWQLACETYRSRKLELQIRLGLKQYGRQGPVTTPAGAAVRGKGTLTIGARVLRCTCGDPASHVPDPCPQALAEAERTVHHGPA